MSDIDVGQTPEEEPTPLQRALDLIFFAPVGVALTVAEDLPGLIEKGRRRFGADVQNARVVGQFVVTRGQREAVERAGKLLHRQPSDSAASSSGDATTTPESSTTSPWVSPWLSPKPDADPADGVIVEGALAGYDTLSASQVVRRLESLGPDELRAIHRHEASHRNRRTILNRIQQILEAKEAGGEATMAPSDTPPSETPPSETPPSETPPSMAEAPEPDRPDQ